MAALFPVPDDGRFCVIHHRNLNSRRGTEAALEMAGELPAYHHAAEGDLCWARVEGELVLYFHHPDALVDTLSRAQLDQRRAQGELWTLEDALEPGFGDLFFVVELKTGSGPRQEAIAAAVRLLTARRPGRFWIDTFSPSDAQIVKQAEPSATVSLHTRGVAGGRVLKTAPEWFPLGLPRLDRLPAIDVVTATWRYTPQRWWPGLGGTPEDATRELAAAGKALVYGGVYDKASFDRVRESGARGAYARFDWQELR